MKIEDTAIAINRGFAEDFSPLQHWAYVERQIKDNISRILKANGLNHKTWYELETQAIREMQTDTVETEFGKVFKLFAYIDPSNPESAKTVTGLKLNIHQSKERHDGINK